MKALRLMAVLAVLAVSTFSFKKAADNFKPTFAAWYLVPGGDPSDPNDYTTNPSGITCSFGDVICQIQADDNGGVPLLNHGNPAENPTAYEATFRSE